MSQHSSVSGETLRGVSMRGRGRGQPPNRISVNIQPTSTRFIPLNKRHYESSSDDPVSSSNHTESEEEPQHTSVTPQLPAISQAHPADAPATLFFKKS
jgi:hypothetical protein